MRSKLVTVYYALILLVLTFSFFSNNFGLIDIQKTALIIAVGVDREEQEFVVTSQIALPKPDQQGEQDAEIVSKGKTVAQAFEQINAKTGWYPKLVFCQLIILGESAVKADVFEVLSFFLRNEYLTDGCLLATCEGSAQELLNAKNPVETLSGLAISKVLSDHAQEVGTVLPMTLRKFSQSYYAEGKSGYMPIIKSESPQENEGQNQQQNTAKNKKSTGQVRDERYFDERLAVAPTSAQQGGKGGQSGGSGSGGGGKSGGDQQQEKVFSASETALFLAGKQIGKLNKEETYTLSFVQSKLRLADYTLSHDTEEITLSIKRNSVKKELILKQEDTPKFEISLTITAGLEDKNRAETIEGLAEVLKAPREILSTAEIKLTKQLRALFLKTRDLKCDLFNCVETLKRKEYSEYFEQRDTLLEEIEPIIKIKFRTVR